MYDLVEFVRACNKKVKSGSLRTMCDSYLKRMRKKESEELIGEMIKDKQPVKLDDLIKN